MRLMASLDHSRKPADRIPVSFRECIRDCSPYSEGNISKSRSDTQARRFTVRVSAQLVRYRLSSLSRIQLLLSRLPCMKAHCQILRSTGDRLHGGYICVETFPGISVEIVDKEESYSSRYQPVLKSDSIFLKWERIAARILKNLDISKWTSLQCWRYGKGDHPEENPVTVIVS